MEEDEPTPIPLIEDRPMILLGFLLIGGLGFIFGAAVASLICWLT